MLYIFQKGFNYSQDGPGNRLVYHLQGCNLHCPWCANPEGLAQCGGTPCETQELVEEVMRSRLLFFEGGGVTLTGGEVCMQLPGARELLTELHRAGIHTCIETNGICAALPTLFPVLDLLIMDVKHYDPVRHRLFTGASNELTVANVREALRQAQPLALRIPLIGGFNADEADAAGFVRLFSELGVAGRATVELLPYHEYGRQKYETLGMPYTMGENAHVTKEQVQMFTAHLENAGITVIHT